MRFGRFGRFGDVTAASLTAAPASATATPMQSAVATAITQALAVPALPAPVFPPTPTFVPAAASAPAVTQLATATIPFNPMAAGRTWRGGYEAGDRTFGAFGLRRPAQAKKYSGFGAYTSPYDPSSMTSAAMQSLITGLDYGTLTGSDGTNPQIHGTPNDAVGLLQQLLIGAGFNSGGTKVDGYFGTETDQDLVSFQTAHSLPATGTVDSATALALVAANATGPGPGPGMSTPVKLGLLAVVLAAAYKFSNRRKS